jgi:hypothetical protein
MTTGTATAIEVAVDVAVPEMLTQVSSRDADLC